MQPVLCQNGTINPALIQIFSIFDLLPANPTFSQLSTIAQQNFLRPKGTERWHLDPLLFKDKEAKLLPLLNQLGFIEAVPPAPGHYDYLIIFGFVTINVENHLNYIAQFLDNNTITCNHIVLLTSSLPLDPALNVPHATEVELMLSHYQKSDLANRPVTCIDVPYNPPSRPNTEDTVKAWLATQPTPGSCLALSGQPFIRRQTQILKTVLPSNFTITATGPASEELPIALYLDELARALYQEAMSTQENLF